MRISDVSSDVCSSDLLLPEWADRGVDRLSQHGQRADFARRRHARRSINDDLRRLDAKASLAVTDNVSLFVEGQNLNDEPTRQYSSAERRVGKESVSTCEFRGSQETQKKKKEKN